MSDSQEKSDDLIAELAKLMATNAGGAEPGPKPSVIKLPPLGEATVKAGPVRIPGMEAPRPPVDSPRPAPATMGAAPTVRIPGMEKPAGVDAISAPQPRPTTQFDLGRPPAPQPRPTTPIDFGKPPAPPAVPTPEPISNWQSSGPSRLPPALPPRPTAVTQLAAMKFDPKPVASDPQKATAPSQPVPPRAEPRIAPLPVVAPAASASAPTPVSDDDFNFDLSDLGGSSRPAPDAPASGDDPIADLIAAGFDLPEDDEFEAAPPARAPSAMPGQAHASVTGRPTQSPVSHESDAPASHAVLPNPLGARTAGQADVRPAAGSMQVRPVTMPPRSPQGGERFGATPAAGMPRPAPQLSPASAPPRVRGADLDPMDEIEDLIGEAVRVELSGSDRPAAPSVNFSGQPAPAVPPLGSGFAPRQYARPGTAG